MEIEDPPTGMATNIPNVRSFSSEVVVTAVKVSEVPGANIAPSLSEEDLTANPNMYIIDLAERGGHGTARPLNEAEVIDHTFISKFKSKNDYLRRVLEYSDSAIRQPSSPRTVDPNVHVTSTPSLSPPPEPLE
ncbi:hypothetical protein FRB98_003824 [Tulasnella sp. 332]|nr:hypothetical protein FRB98_003824 [Tulasnella sp. 332]